MIEGRVQQFWDAYVATSRLRDAQFKVRAFGDSAELADELVALVIAGAKRATTSLRRDFGEPSEQLPAPGDLGIVVDGNNAPRCIVQTVQVDVKPMREVDERFAWDEGEGDRSLVWWRSAHTRYFRRQGAREGFAVDEATEVVL